MNHVVMYSGGIGSWAAAKRVAEWHGTDDLVLLFTDTKTEHPDTYRFLRESAANVGGRLVEIADGRDIWQVFKDEKFLGNSRIDPCSKILKRNLADRWMKQHYTPDNVVAYIGIDWTEEHRYTRMAERKLPWNYQAPLCQPPFLSKLDLHDWAEREGLKKQYLYTIGAAHANCGGGCIKMGQGGFVRLLKNDPTGFAKWEQGEATMRKQLGDVAILTEQRKGVKYKLPLSELRKRAESETESCEIDMYEIGGCGCMIDE